MRGMDDVELEFSSTSIYVETGDKTVDHAALEKLTHHGQANDVKSHKSHRSSSHPTSKYLQEHRTDHEFGKGKFTIIESNERSFDHFHWARKPLLRQEWMDDAQTVLRREKDERRTGFGELFLDLAFVVLIAALAHKLRYIDDISLNTYSQLVILIGVWQRTTLYLNRFDNQDGLHKLFMLFLMMGVLGMGACATNDEPCFAVGVIWARGVIIIMRIGATLFLPVVRVSFALDVFIDHLPFFALIIPSIVLPADIAKWLWFAAALQDFVSPFFILFLSGCSKTVKAHMLPINIEHLVERYGLMMVIILGEGIVGSLFEAGHDLIALQFVSAGLALALTFAVQWLHFDVVSGAHAIRIKKHALRWKGVTGMIWIATHELMFVAFVNTSAGLYNIVHSFGSATAHRRAAVAVGEMTNQTGVLHDGVLSSQDVFTSWMFCGGLAATLLIITISGWTHLRSDATGVRIPKWARNVVRLTVIILIAVLPTFVHNLLHLLVISTCLLFFDVVVELEHKYHDHTGRHHDHKHDADEDEHTHEGAKSEAERKHDIEIMSRLPFEARQKIFQEGGDLSSFHVVFGGVGETKKF